MNAAPAIQFMTVEEYFALEGASEERYEYYDGEVFAMAGASFPHNQISANTLADIHQYLRDKNCRIYGSNLKVNVKTKSAYVYPDLAIICDKPQFLEGRSDIVTNPIAIIEILSPSTEDFDHGRKFMLYRQIPTFKEYILISSMEYRVEKFTKQSTDVWTLKEYKQFDDTILIETINYQTTLTELYRDVVFEEEKEQ